MSDLLRRTIGDNIIIDEALGDSLWSVHADGNQFENALLNVAINARDAMPEGGRLTIQTANVKLGRGDANTGHDVIPGEYVVTAVSDTGAGMTEETLRQAFEPFFTTKPSGLGTGLGLSQVYGFVKQSGGHIKLYSEPGAGSTVRIYLPRHIDVGTIQARQPEPKIPAPLHGTETVLVVEDDPTVREFAHDALTFLGYRVFAADSADAAMKSLVEHSDIALLFTDIGMPRTSGLQLAEDAARIRPRLKILFTTGYGPAAVANSRLAAPSTHLLPKPYTIESLAKLVRATLDNAHANGR
jgi:CheY-like chemotaxis protein